MNPDGTERLAKVLARRGVASRREAERLIEEGKVTVDGEVVIHPGHPVDPRAALIRVEGKRIPDEPKSMYYLLYKPKGTMVTREDPEGRKTVYELLGELGTRVEAVGRLDFNTEGALLLTNDGPLAHALTHPSKGIPKRYLAKIYRTPSPATLERIETGVYLEDGKTGPCKARVVKATDAENAWVEVTVTEGRNRLVRRLFAAVGHPVAKLRRESFATIGLRGLLPGQYRELTAEEVRRLRDLAAGIDPAEAGHKDKRDKAGFAKPDPKWLKRRLDGKKRTVNRGHPPRGGAAR